MALTSIVSCLCQVTHLCQITQPIIHWLNASSTSPALLLDLVSAGLSLTFVVLAWPLDGPLCSFCHLAPQFTVWFFSLEGGQLPVGVILVWPLVSLGPVSVCLSNLMWEEK